MNHEMVICDNGSVWLLADLWRCRDSGSVTGLLRNDDWSSCESDWVSDAFNERVGRLSVQIKVNVSNILNEGDILCVE